MEIIGEKISIKARDNYELAATYWQNETPNGIVAINEGTCVDQKFYSRFAHWLAQQNYDVLTYDYRGVGESAPRAAQFYKLLI